MPWRGSPRLATSLGLEPLCRSLGNARLNRQHVRKLFLHRLFVGANALYRALRHVADVNIFDAFIDRFERLARNIGGIEFGHVHATVNLF